VQLIDARSFFEPLPRSLGKKRKFITEDHQRRVLEAYERFADSAHSRIVTNADLGYRKVWLEQPLKVRYEVTDQSIETLVESLPDLAEGMRGYVGCSTYDREDAEQWIEKATAAVKRLTAPMRRSLWAAITTPDPAGHPAKDHRGQTVASSELTMTDRIPLPQDVDTFMEERVWPFAPDAVIAVGKTRIGYEIPITRYFYTYQPPRDLDEIDADIAHIETEVLALLDRGHG
jgi:type I restriction enzyme M protein